MVIAGLSFALLFVYQSIIIVLVVIAALAVGVAILGLYSPPDEDAG